MTATVTRRTFEAAKHPKGSEERARLNLRAETSEYMTSEPYHLRVIRADGHEMYSGSFRTKRAAEFQRDLAVAR